MVQGVLCGIGGGMVGACVWATLAHFLGHNADFAAWIVGGCVGVGVAFGAQPRLNILTGLLAMALTVVSIMGASFAAAEFATGVQVENTRNQVLSVGSAAAIEALEEQIAGEWQARDAKAAQASARVEATPVGTPPIGASMSAQKPAPAPSPTNPHSGSTAVAEEAKRRWAGMGGTQRQLFKSKLAEQKSSEAGEVRAPIQIAGYFERLTPMQMVWGGLALATAFRIAGKPGRRLDEMEMMVAEAATRNNPILRGSPSASAFAGPGGGEPPARPSTAPSPKLAPSARGKAA